MNINNLFKSRIFAWCAFVLVIAILVLSFPMRAYWWTFIDIFFAFMAAFVNVVSVTVAKINPSVSSKLNTCTLIFLVLFVVSFIVEWVILNF